MDKTDRAVQPLTEEHFYALGFEIQELRNQLMQLRRERAVADSVPSEAFGIEGQIDDLFARIEEANASPEGEEPCDDACDIGAFEAHP